jgi:hypothetical protein
MKKIFAKLRCFFSWHNWRAQSPTAEIWECQRCGRQEYRRTGKKVLSAAAVLLMACGASAQQVISFLTPATAGIQSISLSSPSRQIYPTFYPAENYTLNVQPGSNGFTLNPGTWTVTWPGSYSTTFTVPTNTPATNNWMSLATNPPPAFQAFGLTTNLGLIWTNGATVVTNSFCFTNGVLCAIH